MTRLRVLVVDDERMLAEAIASMLSDHHDVEVYGSMHAAMSRLATGECLDVVLCDLLLPDGSGADVWRRLCELRPDHRWSFVLMTGGEIDGPLMQSLAKCGDRWLNKLDLDQETLLWIVDEVNRRR